MKMRPSIQPCAFSKPRASPAPSASRAPRSIRRRSESRRRDLPESGLPAVIRGGGIGNRLLAALPPADFDLLALSLETVALDQAAVLSRAGDRIEHVLLPHSGAISLMIDMADGQTVGTAIVGREGAIGILSVL